jgi:hypothetical protein
MQITKKKIIFFLLLAHLSLIAQEKEKNSESKKWGATIGVYQGVDRIPMFNLLYKLNERFTFSLSLRKKDIRHTHELINAENYISSSRYDTWRDSFSSRNIIAPGIEWNFKNSPFYLTGRLGIEDYQYHSHTERLFFAEEMGYTSYRTYQFKSHTQKQFGEVGAGFRYLLWDTLIFGMEAGMQKIFNTKYDRTQFDDYSFYQGYSPRYNYTFYSSDPEIKNSWFYATISLGIAF